MTEEKKTKETEAEVCDCCGTPLSEVKTNTQKEEKELDKTQKRG